MAQSYRDWVTRHEIVVVGAGPARLAAAAQLRGDRLDPLVIERSDTIGSAWRTRYDSFRLHTIRWLSGLPGMSMPATLGSWVSRDDFVGYLTRYAERFSIAPGSAPHWKDWLARTTAGCRRTSQGELEAGRVVLGTGACTEPQIPAWTGRDSFRAGGDPLLGIPAARAVRGTPHPGRRLRKLGDRGRGGPGGAAASSTRHASQASSLRRVSAAVPTQPLGIALRFVPARSQPLADALRRLTIPDLSTQGLPAPKRPFSLFRRTGTIPVLDHGFVAAVRSGEIRIRPGVSRLDGDEWCTTTGPGRRPDAVIAGTGYCPGLDTVLGPLSLLDDHGLPTVGSRGGADRAPGLHTVGISIRLSGQLREIGKDAERLARSVPSKKARSLVKLDPPQKSTNGDNFG